MIRIIIISHTLFFQLNFWFDYKMRNVLKSIIIFIFLSNLLFAGKLIKKDIPADFKFVPPILKSDDYFNSIGIEISVNNKYEDIVDDNILKLVENSIKKEIRYHKGRVENIPDIKIKIDISKFKIVKSRKKYIYMDCDYYIANINQNKMELKNRISVSGISEKNINDAFNELLSNFIVKIFDNEEYLILTRNIKRTSNDQNSPIIENLINKVINEINIQKFANNNFSILKFTNDPNQYYTNMVSNYFYTFLDKNKYHLIERNNLKKILEEQKIQLSGIVNDDQIVEIGNLSGVNYLVLGKLNQQGQNKYLRIKIVDTESGEILVYKVTALKNVK